MRLSLVVSKMCIRDRNPTEHTMKVRSSIKRRTKDCQIVIRKGKRIVINKKNPRLKQRQG